TARSSLGNVVGKLEKFQCRITVEPERQRVTQAELSFLFADLKTGHALRDRHLLEWEEGGRFPLARFRMDELMVAPGGTMRVGGTLSMHGVEHAMNFPVSLLVEG